MRSIILSGGYDLLVRIRENEISEIINYIIADREFKFSQIIVPFFVFIMDYLLSNFFSLQITE